MSMSTDYWHPVRKLPSLRGRKSTTTPKFLDAADAHQPKFSDFFEVCLHWVSVVYVLICQLGDVNQTILKPKNILFERSPDLVVSFERKFDVPPTGRNKYHTIGLIWHISTTWLFKCEKLRLLWNKQSFNWHPLTYLKKFCNSLISVYNLFLLTFLH